MKKLVNQILPIEKWKVAYAILFAIMCILDMHIVNEQVAHSTVLTTYLTSFGVMDLPIFVLIMIAAYLVIVFCGRLLQNIAGFFISDKEKKGNSHICFMVIFAVIIIAWIPYFMSCWPGGIYNDTLDSIHIALGEQQMDNQNTVLYALFWRLIFSIGNVVDQGAYGGLKLMTIVQAVYIAATAACFFTWLRKKGVRIGIIIIFTGLIAIMPVFPFYAISLWKDTLFGVTVFLYSWLMLLMVADINRENGSLSLVRTISYIILSLLVAFGRNNGIYIVIVLSIVLTVLYLKKGHSSDVKKILTASVAVILASIIIQIPVYNACGVIKSKPVEKFGIPLQQVAYIISAGGNMSEEEMLVIDSVLPLDGWINLYNPTVVDPIKFDPLFNSGYFNTHTGDFVKAYLGLVIKNPGLAFKGYLLATMGFWDVWKTSSSAYICNVHCYNCEFFMSDYFNQYTGLTLTDIVGPRWYISSGMLIWIMLLAGFAVLQKKNYKMLIPILPTVVLWGTLLIATPLAFSFRYVFPMLLCIPIYVICGCKQDKEKE